MEAEAIIAALLVGVCEETGLNAERIEKLLGSAVARAVQDVTNVWRLSSLLANSPSGDAVQLEDRCKILLAGCDDWRGVVVSLASRLVAIRELEDPFSFAQVRRAGAAEEQTVEERTEEQEQFARELAMQTLQVFVPLAHRLGMWYFKTELEQRCFALTLPRQYQQLSLQLDEVQRVHGQTLHQSAQMLRKALRQDTVISRHVEWVRVQARTKAAYSAYIKMQRKGQTLDELHDVLAIRVIFRPRVTQRLPAGLHRQRQCMLCYRVLEIAHALHAPVSGRRVKDYVTSPKPNGYQSLHSTLQLNGLHAELQIRTSEMHRFAEHGKASHWLYKSAEDQRPAEDWYELSEIRGGDDELQLYGHEELGFRSSAPPSHGEVDAPNRTTAASHDRQQGQPEPAHPALAGRLLRRMGNEPRLQDLPAQGKQRLEAIRRSIREKRVYVTTSGGEVLSLRAGADLQEAVRALEQKNTDGSTVVATALVNGRTVRRGYKICNGDVLTPLRNSVLNSEAWITQDAQPRQEDYFSGAAMPLLPMPWPWSLVGSNDENDLLSWYLEAERKHGQIAVLALANWIALACAGEISLLSEPLGSLYLPRSGMTWALQFGSIALAEAYFLQRRTTYAIRHAQDEAAATSAGEEVDEEGAHAHEALGPEPWSLPSVPLSVASDPSLGAAVPDEAPIGAIFPGTLAKNRLLLAEGAPRVGDIRRIMLWMGRIAMVVMAGLALHADSEHGILHDFLQVGIPDITVAAPMLDMDVDDVEAVPPSTAPLFTDVMLQDLPSLY